MNAFLLAWGICKGACPLAPLDPFYGRGMFRRQRAFQKSERLR
jgi:hypothetical protein